VTRRGRVIKREERQRGFGLRRCFPRCRLGFGALVKITPGQVAALLAVEALLAALFGVGKISRWVKLSDRERATVL
jgi:hypothetical protein